RIHQLGRADAAADRDRHPAGEDAPAAGSGALHRECRARVRGPLLGHDPPPLSDRGPDTQLRGADEAGGTGHLPAGAQPARRGRHHADQLFRNAVDAEGRRGEPPQRSLRPDPGWLRPDSLPAWYQGRHRTVILLLSAEASMRETVRTLFGCVVMAACAACAPSRSPVKPPRPGQWVLVQAPPKGELAENTFPPISTWKRVRVFDD